MRAPITAVVGRPPIGSRVRFWPNPNRQRGRLIEAEVVGYRKDPRGGFAGWIETVDDDRVRRSVRASRCEVVECAKGG